MVGARLVTGAALRGGVLAIGLLLVATFTAPGPSTAASPSAAPEIQLTAEPTSAPVGQGITVTGTVSGGQGAAHWEFTAPDFVEVAGQADNVLELTCRAAGTDSVTATYADDAGGDVASVTVTCTGTAPAPTSGSATPSSVVTPPPPAPTPPTSESPTPSVTESGSPTSRSDGGPLPAPTATPEDPLRTQVDRALEQLEPGWVSYRPPTSMREGDTADLVVRVQRRTTPTNPTDVPGEGPVVVEELEVGTPMTAELTGEDFEVEPEGPQTRVLGSTRPAEWSWRVTPRATGDKDLRLELAVLLDEDDDTPVAHKTYVATIDVRVDLVQTPLRLAKSATSLLGALGLTVAAVVGAALAAWRRRRQARAAQAPGAPAPAATGRGDGGAKRRRPPPPKRTKRRRRGDRRKE